ncbi:DNA polymerase III subunit alpha [Thalassobacillus devorans]|uniref:DNA polymerase III subunit alpha n=1 Tax=Thalassobacillus devorans TaxID=279813 RepID=UPI000A1CA8A5|nr:DNA polymerase III subunit alpha [Thalassobacillus devorans]
MASFTHLQVRSGYSLMKSSISIKKLVERAKQSGFNSLALTDEGVLHGALEFYQACHEADIHPVIGMSVELVEGETLFSAVLLAENQEGYRNLLKLSTYIQTGDTRSLELEELQPYTTGVIFILPAAGSPLAVYLEKGQEEAAYHFFSEWSSLFERSKAYIGVEDHQLEKERRLHRTLKPFVDQYGIAAVALQDVRYLQEEDAQAYDCLTAIREGRRWSSDAMDNSNKNRHLRNPDEMEELFSDWWPEILTSSNQIADQCKVTLALEEKRIPNFPVPDGKNSDEYLKELCMKALEKMEETERKQAKERLEYEWGVIASMNFSDYFLIVWDFVAYAKRNNIKVGPGRGSAAGSLVAYLLGITEVNPIQYDLLFERFLNPERVTMPDIDIDFSDHRRDEVIQYVTNKYGTDRVAQIITFGTFAARSLLRELFKTIGIDQQDAAFILKEFSASSDRTIVGTVKQSEELAAYIRQSRKLQLLFKIAAKLEGLPRHTSTHAAGVVISDVPLTQEVPLMAGHEGVPLTQYAMGDLETIGLLKMDFLGLRNLTLLERIEANIIRSGNPGFSLDSIPFEDTETYQLLRDGRTNGIFQLESQGMKNVLQRLKPNRFEDVVAVNALYRPGPMEYIPVYIARKHGETSVTYPHPDVEPILEKTFGVLVYQEQIMQVANQIAGFSLGQADILRRAVSKKKQGLIEEQYKAFIEGARQQGYQENVAEEIYKWIVKFSNYGFNRSHAVAYSMISYQLAYLKTHYPAFFLAELMNANAGNHEKLASYIREAKDTGVQVLSPSINHSNMVFRVKKGNIHMGLLSIKGVGMQAVQEILETRKQGPFKNIFDFCLRVPLKAVNRQVIEALILAGAFDEIYNNRASLLASVDHAIEQGELFKEFDDQPSFFQDELTLDVNYVQTEPFSQMKQLSMEKEVLGTYMSRHPLETYRQKLRANAFIALRQMDAVKQKKRLKACGVVEHIKQIRTKRGDPMAFMTISDEQGEAETVIFPELYRKVRPWLQEEMLICFEGNIEDRNNQLQWLLADIQPFSEDILEADIETPKKLFIKLSEQEELDALQAIRQIAEHFPGNTPVIVHHARKGKTYQLSSEYYVKLTRECLTALHDYFGKDSVVPASAK